VHKRNAVEPGHGRRAYDRLMDPLCGNTATGRREQRRMTLTSEPVDKRIQIRLGMVREDRAADNPVWTRADIV
jgi:hypothetical protein